MIAFKNGGPPIEWGKSVGPTGGAATWRRVVPHPDKPASFQQDIALVVCPRGHESVLSGSVHSVAADGTVRPSYVCPDKNCPFHDFVQLEGWTP